MRLVLKSFMSHDSSVIELPSTGVVLITGPNGAGKSAVAEAISQALWGKSLRGSRWSPWRAEAGRVELQDGPLRVIRGWTGKSKTLKWMRSGDESGHDTKSKTQEDLESVVGSHEVWRRTSVFSAADAAHFTMASDAERKDLLEQLLGLGWFDRALEACRADLRVAHGSLNATERDLASHVARAEGLASGVKQAQEALSAMAEPAAVGLARAELVRLAEMAQAAQRDADAAQAARRELLQAGGRDDERARAANERLQRLGPTCYACGQDVSEGLRATMRSAVETSVRAAEAARAAVAADLARVTAETEELRDEAAQLMEMSSSSRATIAAADATRANRLRLVEALAASGEALAAIADKINEARAKVEGLRVDVTELQACERVLGGRGARAHVVGATLGAIEGAANAWMQKLQSTIEIQLKPYTEKKSGGVVDSISLQLRGAGGDGGYAGASAGERRRVDVSILLALSELAGASARGSEWQSPIFFDELFDSLDEDGREAVLELVEQVAQHRLVVLITHDENVALVRADVRIRVDHGRVV